MDAKVKQEKVTREKVTQEKVTQEKVTQEKMNREKVAHESLSVDLMARHDMLVDLIGRGPFHYVDIPLHGNVGDMLIMHGTLAFFRKKNLEPKLIAPFFAYDPRWIEPGDVVVFHGGGNFGDLYPYYQDLRETVVRTCKENRIVVLPQSLHFSSAENMARSAKIFRTHDNVHICARDRESFAMAKEFSDHVYLLPDMAHQLYPMNAGKAGQVQGTLRISRVDDERGSKVALPNVDVNCVTDWPELVGKREWNINQFQRAMGFSFRRGMGRPVNRILAPLWIAYSERLTADAARLFARHETVITDRLHGHILACLLRKENTVIDNSYGKNSRYVHAWTGSSELVTLSQHEQQPSSSSNPALSRVQ
jgi:pyruvyl transferase EpsO